ncbi:MAG: peptidylprolyl isomerase [Phycisphaerales bacterium]|nr:peptidylprolyl isomerase [Phycisphaerales bacterium]
MKKLTLSLFALAISSTFSFAQHTKIAITTEYGKIVMELYNEAPKHRDNMIKLAKEHFFDSTLFHRCIPNFVIQGGDPNSKNAAPGAMLGNGETGYRVDAEFNDSLIHKYGALAMARDNNPDKASSGCQFYIVTGKKLTDDELNSLEQRNNRKYSPSQRDIYKTKGGTAFLDGNYSVFGEVIEGMDIVEKIALEPRDQMDRPKKDIRMMKVEVIEPKAAKKKKKFLGIF